MVQFRFAHYSYFVLLCVKADALPQTGVFASAFALGDLFSFVLHRDTYLYAMFAYPIGRIYTNVSSLFPTYASKGIADKSNSQTLLDTLNSRQTLKDKMGSGVQEADVRFSPLPFCYFTIADLLF